MSNPVKRSFKAAIEDDNADISDLFGVTADEVVPTKRRRAQPARIIEEPMEQQLEVSEIPQQDEDLSDVADLVDNATDLMNSGASDFIIEPIVNHAVQKVQTMLTTTKLRKEDPRTKRIMKGIQLLSDHLSQGLTIDNPDLVASFAAMMGYSDENTAQSYAQLSIDLALAAIVNSQYDTIAVKEYAIAEMERLNTLGYASLGVIQRRLLNIRAVVNRFSQTLLKHSNKSAVNHHESLYTISYDKYFNYNNDANRNLMKFVVVSSNNPNQMQPFRIHNVSLSKDQPLVAMTVFDITKPCTKFATAYYLPSVTPVDTGFINALKTSRNTFFDAPELSVLCHEFITTASSHFFGRGDITSLALRIVKVFEVYSRSQEWKKKFSSIVDGVWIFNDARADIGKTAFVVRQGAAENYKSPVAPRPGIWEDKKGVGASAYQRALWYFGSYLGYGRKAEPEGYKYSVYMESGLTGLIGQGSSHILPSMWLLAFYKKVNPTATEMEDAEAMSNFLMGEDGELYRYVSTGVINPINLKSEAGCPYPPKVKKINALNDIFVMADKVYKALISGHYGKQDMMNKFPEIFCVVVKPKAEVFPFETPIANFSLDSPDEITDIRPFIESNRYLPKGRGIFVPCSWTAIPFGFITSFISHLYKSEFVEIYNSGNEPSRFYDYQLEQQLIPLKDISFAYGMFDFYIRRVQGQYPFNSENLRETSNYGVSSYADNIYAFGEVGEAFESEDDTIVLVHQGEGIYKQSEKTIILPGTRVFLSMDGEKAESATDESDAFAYLTAFCEFFKVPPDVSTFILNAARYGINGGVCLFGDKQIKLRWQGSGNQLTFSLNDFKMAQVLQHYNQLTEPGKANKIHWPTLKLVGTYYGVSLTLERVITLPPLGEDLLADGQELDMDILGLSARNVMGSNFHSQGKVVAPILAQERRRKAMLFSKSIHKATIDNDDKDVKTAGENVQAGFIFAIKAISLLLSGCVLISYEKDICYCAIITHALQLKNKLLSTDSSTVVGEVVDASLDIKSLLATIKEQEFATLLTTIASTALDYTRKLGILDQYFVPKYLSLVSFPATYARRASYIISRTHLKHVGAVTPYSVMAPVLPAVFRGVTNSLVKFQSSYKSEAVYRALVFYDAMHPGLWPSDFIIADNGNISSVTFDKENPDFQNRMNSVLESIEPKQPNTKAFQELVRESLRWYLLDNPHRSNNYGQAMEDMKEKTKNHLDGITRHLQMIPTTYSNDLQNESIGNTFYRQANIKTNIPTPLAVIRDNKLKESSLTPGLNSENVDFSHKWSKVERPVLKPSVSLNPYCYFDQLEDNTPSNWHYPNEGVNYSPTTASIKLGAQRFISAIGIVLFNIMSNEAVLSKFRGLTRSQVNQYKTMVNLNTKYPLEPYRPQMDTQVKLVTLRLFEHDPARFSVYHKQPVTYPVGFDSLTLGMGYEDELAVPNSLLIYDRLHSRPFILSDGDYNLFKSLPPQVSDFLKTKGLGIGIEQFRLLVDVLCSTPVVQIALEIKMAQLNQPLYKDSPAAANRMLRIAISNSSHEESSFNIPSAKATKAVTNGIKTIEEPLFTESEEGTNINMTIVDVLGRALWMATEMVLDDKLVKIVTMRRATSKLVRDVGMALIHGSNTDRNSVWECYYDFCLCDKVRDDKSLKSTNNF